MNKLLEIKNLYVQYNTDESVVHAINGLDLSLHKGETLGLVGETGAGKSTMALSILKLLPDKVGQVTNGSIVYDGQDIFKKSKKEMRQIRGAKISMIFQDPMTSLNPVTTVGDQLLEVLDLHFPEMSKDEKNKKVDEMMQLVGIPASRKEEYSYQFSGGMKQRIVIAMALITQPELLLADEPTTALDVTIQAQILELMRQLKEQFNTAMIFITHDLGVVSEICDNVAVMYAGEVIEHGTVEEVFAQVKNHPYTEGLFECIPNLTVDTKRLNPIPGFMADPTDLPEGCKFASRCKKCMDICKRKAPGMHKVNELHSIKCHLFADGKENEA